MGREGEVSVGVSVSDAVNEVRFTIPLAFPSVNSLHQIIYSQRKVELKPEVRRWRSDAKQHIPRFIPRSESSLLRADVVFHYPFYHANGKLREFDTHNAVKPLLDVIAEKLGFNDKRVKSGSWDSVDSLNEKVEVVLREVVNGSSD
jgi:endodeoxyribonuclease RusA